MNLNSVKLLMVLLFVELEQVWIDVREFCEEDLFIFCYSFVAPRKFYALCGELLVEMEKRCLNTVIYFENIVFENHVLCTFP